MTGWHRLGQTQRRGRWFSICSSCYPDRVLDIDDTVEHVVRPVYASYMTWMIKAVKRRTRFRSETQTESRTETE